MKRNILIIGSNIHNAVGYEWVVDKINHDKFNVHFILMNEKDSVLETYLTNHPYCHFKRIHYTSKKDLIKSFWAIKKYIKQHNIDVIHTHLLDASLAGLFAAKIAGVQNRIHTRHHSDYHLKYHKHGVMYDKMINYLSTKILAVTSMVKTLLVQEEKVNPSKVEVVNHGFDIESLINVSTDEVNQIKSKYQLTDVYPVIGCISRYVELKGLQYSIPAFKELLKKYPNAVLVLANANGSYKNKIQELLKDIPKNNYREIVFEDNVKALYKTFDIFVHTPIDYSCEAFGQIYIESLALKIPSIFTLSGVANDFAENGKNCLLVKHKNTQEILDAMLLLLQNEDLKKSIINKGFQVVQNQYGVDKMIKQLEEVYLL